MTTPVRLDVTVSRKAVKSFAGGDCGPGSHEAACDVRAADCFALAELLRNRVRAGGEATALKQHVDDGVAVADSGVATGLQ